MKKPVFGNGGIYHVYNRGVEKRNVFLDDHDYFRFLYSLYEFNDKNPAYKISEVRLREAEIRKEFLLRERKTIVDIFAFCLMDNHFHLLVRQIADEGIVRFMHKVGTGYTNYFNKKYERVGPLFQGSFKAVKIENESHLLHLPYYIHANPLDLVMSKWRQEGITDCKKATHFLEQYKYSSHMDYMGNSSYTSILQMKFLSSILGNHEEYRKNMNSWLNDHNFSDLQDVVLE